MICKEIFFASQTSSHDEIELIQSFPKCNRHPQEHVGFKNRNEKSVARGRVLMGDMLLPKKVAKYGVALNTVRLAVRAES